MTNIDINNIDSISPLDYENLKEYGLKYIQSIANKNWTDFNLHDPGVTILEALCFGLTDLAYRTDFEMKDLLTKKGEFHPSLNHPLFQADIMFSSNPLTINEYRKFILEKYRGDVKNIHISTSSQKVNNTKTNQSISVNGFYNVCIQPQRNSYEENIKQKIFTDLNSHRNIGEIFDIENIKIQKPIDLAICIEIEIDLNANLSSIITNIYKKVSHFINPSIPYYNLAQLLKKGKSLEEIYHGYLSDSGLFIDIDELKSFNKKTIIHNSDIINIIMSIDGVNSINHFHFITNDSDLVKITDYDIKLLNENDYFFDLIPFEYSTTQSQNSNKICINRNGYAIPVNLKENTSETAVEESSQSTEFKNLDSKNRNIHHYYSFQNLFPKCYQLGVNGISNNDSDLRKAQRLQLKGYLTFFDQILADYLAQLDNICEYFSIEQNESDYKNYFYSTLSNDEIIDLSKILNYKNADYQRISHPNKTNDRIKLLDHLLARFNDSFAEYAILSYIRAYSSETELIEKKKEFLNNYPSVSSNRTQGTDLSLSKWTICGIEKRILSKIGINNFKNRLTPPYIVSKIQKESETNKDFEIINNITFINNHQDDYENCFGIHIIDHIIFTPKTEKDDTFIKLTEKENSSKLVNDPYSFHATIVLPGWLDFCQKIEFRDFIETIIREELPAHIITKICWVSPIMMYHLESILHIIEDNNTSKQTIFDYLKQEETLKKFVSTFNQIKNIYPNNNPEVDSEINKLDGTYIDTSDFEPNALFWSYDLPLEINIPTGNPEDNSNPHSSSSSSYPSTLIPISSNSPKSSFNSHSFYSQYNSSINNRYSSLIKSSQLLITSGDKKIQKFQSYQKPNSTILHKSSASHSKTLPFKKPCSYLKEELREEISFENNILSSINRHNKEEKKRNIKRKK